MLRPTSLRSDPEHGANLGCVSHATYQDSLWYFNQTAPLKTNTIGIISISYAVIFFSYCFYNNFIEIWRHIIFFTLFFVIFRSIVHWMIASILIYKYLSHLLLRGRGESPITRVNCEVIIKLHRMRARGVFVLMFRTWRG